MAYKPKILALNEGGSNASLTADNGGIIYSTASAMAVLASTSTANQPLLSGASGAPGWSTATYPGSTTANRILYSSSNNVVGQITTANSGVLTTDGSGVPTITNTLSLVSSGTTMETLESTDAGAGAGPIVDLYRNSASPAASDVIGQIQFNGRDTAPSKNLYAQITGQIDVETSGSENSRLTFATQTGGALTTQLAMLNTGCQVRGNNTNTAPPAGFIGEVISSVVGSGAPVNLTASVISNLTSLALTPGVWDVTFALQLARTASGTNATAVDFGISATSATIEGSVGDKWFESYSVPTGGAGVQFQYVFPAYRLLLSANTTYYAWATTNGTLQNYNIYGRMSAVRVG